MSRRCAKGSPTTRWIVAAWSAVLCSGCFVSFGDLQETTEPACQEQVAPVGQNVYVIPQRSAAEVVINGQCDEPVWEGAAPVPTFGYTSPGLDNMFDCRMFWSSADDAIYGCCVVEDTDLISTVTGNDSTDIWQGDRFEHIFGADIYASTDPSTTKVIVDVAGFHYDFTYDADGVVALTYDASVELTARTNGELNDQSSDDVGYTLEWRANLGFAPIPGQLGRCDFARVDVDEGAERTVSLGFVTDDTSINYPQQWGFCRFACPE